MSEYTNRAYRLLLTDHGSDHSILSSEYKYSIAPRSSPFGSIFVVLMSNVVHILSLFLSPSRTFLVAFFPLFYRGWNIRSIWQSSAAVTYLSQLNQTHTHIDTRPQVISNGSRPPSIDRSQIGPNLGQKKYFHCPKRNKVERMVVVVFVVVVVWPMLSFVDLILLVVSSRIDWEGTFNERKKKLKLPHPYIWPKHHINVVMWLQAINYCWLFYEETLRQCVSESNISPPLGLDQHNSLLCFRILSYCFWLICFRCATTVRNKLNCIFVVVGGGNGGNGVSSQ